MSKDIYISYTNNTEHYKNIVINWIRNIIFITFNRRRYIISSI